MEGGPGGMDKISVLNPSLYTMNTQQDFLNHNWKKKKGLHSGKHQGLHYFIRTFPQEAGVSGQLWNENLGLLLPLPSLATSGKAQAFVFYTVKWLSFILAFQKPHLALQSSDRILQSLPQEALAKMTALRKVRD